MKDVKVRVNGSDVEGVVYAGNTQDSIMSIRKVAVKYLLKKELI